MVVPPAPDGAGLTDPSHDTTSSTGSSTARRPGLRLALAGLLGLVCLVCAVILVVDLVQGLAEGEEADVQASREEVMSVTDQFVKRLGTYGPDMVDDSGQMPDYREQVTEVITDKFGADFTKQVDTVEQLVVQAGVEREAAVFATGVSSIDDDSARVLVAGSFTDTYTQGTGKKARTIEQEPLPFRLVIDLVAIDGEWLVDDFTPASADGEEQPQPGQPQPGQPQPTLPSPTEGGAS